MRSKWAVVGFMECPGQEMVKRSIRVSTVGPGSVDTSFWDDLNVDRAGTESHQSMMSPEDVAEVVMLQLRLPLAVLLKRTLMFPTIFRPACRTGAILPSSWREFG